MTAFPYGNRAYTTTDQTETSWAPSSKHCISQEDAYDLTYFYS